MMTKATFFDVMLFNKLLSDANLYISPYQHSYSTSKMAAPNSNSNA